MINIIIHLTINLVCLVCEVIFFLMVIKKKKQIKGSEINQSYCKISIYILNMMAFSLVIYCIAVIHNTIDYFDYILRICDLWEES